MIENFTKETFAEHLNTKVRIPVQEGDPLELEIVSATGDDAESGQPRRQICFSILFRGPQDKFLSQRIYRMEHDRLGTFDLFLVPVSRDEQGIYYEAAFNRMVK